MSAIHDEILTRLQSDLEEALINDVLLSDIARAGVVKLGYLQGDPDPDDARISVTLHVNDPDALRGMATPTSLSNDWNDKVMELELGSGHPIFTWQRRFSIQARILLESTQEDLPTAIQIAAALRNRIEATLVGNRLTGVAADDGEYVCRGIYSFDAETIQSGGPDAYDFLMKGRFEVWTSTTGE